MIAAVCACSTFKARFPPPLDKALYERRHLIEDIFREPEEIKRIATRVAKVGQGAKAMIDLAAALTLPQLLSSAEFVSGGC